jgi:hydroxymethylpyrimidine/phosphomethylpyrimidine kinase
MTPPVALSIAGTDSGGAAGLAADIATFSALGVHGACVVTAVTAQDTLGVHGVHPVPLPMVADQITAVLGDLPVGATKTGMLGSPEVVELVATRLAGSTLVVDPVLVASSGAVLGDERVARAYLQHLLPVATIATPNLDEARALTGCDADAAELAARLADLGCAVVVTGGPEGEGPRACTDWLALPGERAQPLRHRFVATTNTHGTGCTHSAALAGVLARCADPTPADLLDACRRAADVTARQLTTSATWRLGRGRGPVAHTRTTQP